MKKLLLVIGLILVFGITPCYSADQWDKDMFADDSLIPAAPGLMRVNNEAIDRILQHYQMGAGVFYSSATAVTVAPGSVVCSNSGGTVRRLRSNTSSTSVGWANIDTGAEAGSTTYYVYAVADTDATTFTVEISTSSSAPVGATYYLKLGSFYNNSSSNIDNYKVYSNAYYPAPTDSSGIPKVTAIYSYATSTSSYTLVQSSLKVAFGYVSVAGASTTSISNLPFTSAATYSCSGDHRDTGNLAKAACQPASGSSLTVRNEHADARIIQWIAIGY